MNIQEQSGRCETLWKVHHATGRVRSKTLAQHGCMPLTHAALAACAFLAGTTPAFADFGMPVVFVFAPFASVWAMSLGLLVEFLFVWRFLRLKAGRSLVAVIVANVVSTAAGWIVIMFPGAYIEGRMWTLSGKTPFLLQILVVGAALLLITAVNTAIEMPVLSRFGVHWRWRSVWIVYAANFVSVAMLLAVLATGLIQG